MLHGVMFALTFVTTMCAGALQEGVDVFREPSGIVRGLPFSLSLMTVLLVHELAHYLMSKKRYVEATPPLFIPAPSIIGTFGAFIRMKSPVRSRKALIDISAAGPLAGFVASLVVSVIGLSLSEIRQVENGASALVLGESLLTTLLTHMIFGEIPVNHDVFLHPIAFAGWIGFFVTSLNLIPIGQLDGGHIAFALLGKMHRKLSIALTCGLVVLGIFLWLGWLIWAVLLIILGMRHPPVMVWEGSLDAKRRLLCASCFLIFLITFVPSPFEITL